MLLCNIRPGSLLLRCSAIILYVDEELHTGYMSEVAQDTQPLIAAEEASVDTQVGTLAERHPDWPSVNLNILFGHHESAADMADVEAALQSGNVNIYFYENSSGDKTHATELFQRFSDADLEADVIRRDNLNQFLAGRFKGTPDEPVLRGIAGTGIAIGCIDLAGQYPEIITRITAADEPEIDVSGDYKQALDHLLHQGREYATAQRERERFIVSNIEPELERLMKERPELMQKPELNILLSMGELHATLARDIGKAA